jgi:hypothetical protein
MPLGGEILCADGRAVLVGRSRRWVVGGFMAGADGQSVLP